MTESTKVILIACATVVVATVLFSGIYHGVPVPGAVYVVNRFTGGVTFCNASHCDELGPRPPATPRAQLSSFFKHGTALAWEDVDHAHNAGYSDAAIAGFLAPLGNLDIAAAHKDGVGDAAIISHLVDIRMPLPDSNGWITPTLKKP